MKPKRRTSTRRDASPLARDAWDGEVTRSALPDSIEDIGEEWLWAESTSVFHQHHDIADDRVQRVLDEHDWLAFPRHGDGAEATRAIRDGWREERAEREALPPVRDDRRGALNPAAKLDDLLVMALRRRHASGESIGDLANEAGVSYATAHSAITGRSWTHLPMPGDGGDSCR